mgnify:CR=1 FL=1
MAPRAPEAEELAREERAGELLTLAARLACTVRDDGADAAAALLAGLDRRALVELAVVMAALIPDDRTFPELLAWLGTGWVPDAGTLPAQLLPFATGKYRRTAVYLRRCGTWAAYKRHRRAGEPVDEECARAAAAYARAQYARRQARKLAQTSPEENP